MKQLWQNCLFQAKDKGLRTCMRVLWLRKQLPWTVFPEKEGPTILLGVSGGVLGRLASSSKVRRFFALGSSSSPTPWHALPADLALTSMPAQTELVTVSRPPMRQLRHKGGVRRRSSCKHCPQ